MQKREFNRATFRVANTTDMSGRATADKINCDLWTAKGSKLWRIACLTFLGFLTVAGFFFAVTPLPVRADNDEDSGHGRKDNDKEIRAEITALQAQVSSLQATVSTLQDQVNSLKTSNIALQNQLAHAKNVLALDPFVSVDPNPEIGVIGPNIIFSGANIHIVSGSGKTNDNGAPTGLGNLIIGYDEKPVDVFGIGPDLNPGDRGGSHNLVIGRGNRFTQGAFGGLVAGEVNAISNEGASVLGGAFSTASGLGACVIGGNGANTASGQGSVVLGGQGNTASGQGGPVVLGGGSNTARGYASVVLCGQINTASGSFTVVLGGTNVTDNKDNSIAPQPPFP